MYSTGFGFRAQSYTRRSKFTKDEIHGTPARGLLPHFSLVLHQRLSPSLLCSCSAHCETRELSELKRRGENMIPYVCCSRVGLICVSDYEESSVTRHAAATVQECDRVKAATLTRTQISHTSD